MFPGGNVQVWAKDQRANDSFKTRRSWWYGSKKTRKKRAQYKLSNFYAIYVGFRCAFNN